MIDTDMEKGVRCMTCNNNGYGPAVFQHARRGPARAHRGAGLWARSPSAAGTVLSTSPLSNMVNAGISKVGSITKSNYQSLMDHLGSGKAVGPVPEERGAVSSSPPSAPATSCMTGRIASLCGITPFLRNSKEEYVVLSDCHVVGNIDYDRLLEAHIASGADITIAYKHGPRPRVRDG